ncbi:alpha/beta hydrolase [Novipirellula artificiosorum]|uniref:Acetylxylan esterase n=1 Tax=Novipirellula artificiosorum TaxID=2528016 RepID=A0A5C6DXI5_9BACT|nr:alpha/beta hydrolase [Novipirellula artificiosorum]TWU41115.1 Acetylxylan esterase precursor [Novipirellula artificiosorum]
MMSRTDYRPRQHRFAKFSISLVLCMLSSVTTPLVTAEEPAAVAAKVAEADAVVPVWPTDPPAWNAPTMAEQDTSGPDGRNVAGKSVIRLGYVTSPELHIYRAKAGVQSDTAVVVCPGGGYSILAWDLEGTEIAELLQEMGVTAVVLKYRVPSRGEAESWKPAVQDIQRAISLVRAGAIPEVKVSKVGVLGFSAGGNASARAATATQRHYDSVDSHDQQNYLPDFAVLVYPAWLVEKDNPTQLIDGITVSDQTPPMFFAHARNDGISCLNSITLFTELQKRDKPASLHVFSGGGHGFGARPNDQETDAWPELLELWMREQEWLGK